MDPFWTPLLSGGARLTPSVCRIWPKRGQKGGQKGVPEWPPGTPQGPWGGHLPRHSSSFAKTKLKWPIRRFFLRLMEIPALMIHEKGQRSMKMTVFGSFLDPFLTLFGLLGQYGQKGSKSCAMLLIGWPFWPFWHPWKRGSKRWSQKIDIWPFSIDRGLK